MNYPKGVWGSVKQNKVDWNFPSEYTQLFFKKFYKRAYSNITDALLFDSNKNLKGILVTYLSILGLWWIQRLWRYFHPKNAYYHWNIKNRSQVWAEVWSLRFLGLFHRIPPTGWCKTTEVYSLTNWKGPKSKIKVLVGWFLLGDPRERLLQTSWFLADSPGCSLASYHSSLCLPVYFSVPSFPLRRPAGLITGLGLIHLNPVWPHCNWSPWQRPYFLIFGRPKSSFGFFRPIWWGNPN